ncbi:hypothetical protein BigBertha_16 [Bacillus phage BigBertha]|uniref:Uncharacterized protein n=3 Tax=Caudoviricetes TaxID=2731619 RepID=U5PRP7_9CAUD|nr:hypothetical protein BigBertha_16 [Bacillus phage BigBertha]AGY46524.1 hypothetical protein BigBertha_16 [Bacillus phage BigBertha]AMW61641.1 hypothetical protein JUGLONE_16 [Bacillus phage Juglone]
MTKHTRNKQLIKATKDKKLARKMYAKGTNVAIDDKQLNVYSSELDKQFEWVRIPILKSKVLNYIMFTVGGYYRKSMRIKELKQW